MLKAVKLCKYENESNNNDKLGFFFITPTDPKENAAINIDDRELLNATGLLHCYPFLKRLL